MEVWELKLYFYPSAGGLQKKKEKSRRNSQVCKDPRCAAASPVGRDVLTYIIVVPIPNPGERRGASFNACKNRSAPVFIFCSLFFFDCAVLCQESVLPIANPN